ncbi:fumarylacetoacetate hydrolase family protein [Oceanospirillum sediminis]|uniref:Fumarylacetoacetate hydrolase family protein n=1 Tax=Oceanospirillum sediminis TaxID=2760088 RepID=A0A839IP15_9GAMM|nr:fumarylacetoacetate hydrolase family protein [Oceanospirillum sediminis]MBB1486207.1 fumarylacetoacetate hydrolase family protein [Oceanospirillum sediminis]
MSTNPIVTGKLVCVALNDQQQLDKLDATFNEAPYKAAPTQPVLYFKPHNTWNTDGATIAWNEEGLVVGASLTVVFGKECCRTSAEEALSYVEGYTLTHDFSLPEKSYYRPDIKGKCQDGTAPVGAVVVPASDVADPQALTVVTQVNGETVGELPVSQLHRGVAELISIISNIMTLQPGDAIAVGFPGDRHPVKQGDKVTSSIAGVTELTNQVEA